MINQPSWPHIPANSPYVKRLDTTNFVRAGRLGSEVVIVLDASYSMQDCREKTIEGYNEFIRSQQGTTMETRLSLYEFTGSAVNALFLRVPADHVAPLTMESFNPRGRGTNLLDAFGFAMQETNRRLTQTSENIRPTVTVVLLTDGQENASHKFNNEQIKGMVSEAEKMDWTFMFLGAGPDAFTAGGAMGFTKANTLAYNTRSADNAWGAATRAVGDMKAAKLSGMSTAMAYTMYEFTDEERAKANDDN